MSVVVGAAAGFFFFLLFSGLQISLLFVASLLLLKVIFLVLVSFLKTYQLAFLPLCSEVVWERFRVFKEETKRNESSSHTFAH